MKNITFKINDLKGGFMMVEGSIRLEGQSLFFEFYEKDALVQLYKSELKKVEIPVSSLSMIEMKKKWFQYRLIIHGKAESVLTEIPGNEIGKRTLIINKSDALFVSGFASRINLELSEQKLRELED